MIKKFNEYKVNESDAETRWWVKSMWRVIWSGDSVDECGEVADKITEGSYHVDMVDLEDGTYMVVGDKEAREYYEENVK